MNQTDPTDHALAAVVSIHDQPEPGHMPEEAVVEEIPVVPALADGEGYSKVGPGPMEAIRFKWTVRRAENADYFVDETIGENSLPIISGPMTKDAAIRFVDDQASEARQRFEQLKNEMAGRSAAAVLTHHQDGDEA